MKMKTLSRSFRRDLVTYGMVVVMFLAIQLLSGMGMLTNSLSGQLVPICAYIIMAISLNLTVGILGELSLGHAGFMSVGGFVGAFVSVCVGDAVPCWLCFTLRCWRDAAAACSVIDWHSCIALHGYYLAIVTLPLVNHSKTCSIPSMSQRCVRFHVSLKTRFANLDEKACDHHGAHVITGIREAQPTGLGIVLISSRSSSF
jgi:branched-chain amino acid transport system permease protein